ncbi:hypothetical protein MYP_2265 [Sporocytophaga myxococcoides]|uniref:Uncharacterized protein n=1 Tax=Sporocytophaga myxococcoides TaxID=153721 RepID=A0A098LF12_9BACT|nr:hypothetical protein MYP_2265 [Sporocytophaga myxococcoides]
MISSLPFALSWIETQLKKSNTTENQHHHNTNRRIFSPNMKKIKSLIIYLSA